jgi:hypothetical protein
MSADHEFVSQCCECGEPHGDCECEEFVEDDWCAECGESYEEHEEVDA